MGKTLFCFPHVSKSEEMFLIPELDEALHWIHWGAVVPRFPPAPRKLRAVWELAPPQVSIEIASPLTSTRTSTLNIYLKTRPVTLPAQDVVIA